MFCRFPKEYFFKVEKEEGLIDFEEESSDLRGDDLEDNIYDERTKCACKKGHVKYVDDKCESCKKEHVKHEEHKCEACEGEKHKKGTECKSCKKEKKDGYACDVKEFEIYDMADEDYIHELEKEEKKCKCNCKCKEGREE